MKHVTRGTARFRRAAFHCWKRSFESSRPVPRVLLGNANFTTPRVHGEEELPSTEFLGKLIPERATVTDVGWQGPLFACKWAANEERRLKLNKYIEINEKKENYWNRRQTCVFEMFRRAIPPSCAPEEMDFDCFPFWRVFSFGLFWIGSRNNCFYCFYFFFFFPFFLRNVNCSLDGEENRYEEVWRGFYIEIVTTLLQISIACYFSEDLSYG